MKETKKQLSWKWCDWLDLIVWRIEKKSVWEIELYRKEKKAIRKEDDNEKGRRWTWIPHEYYSLKKDDPNEEVNKFSFHFYISLLEISSPLSLHLLFDPQKIKFYLITYHFSLLYFFFIYFQFFQLFFFFYSFLSPLTSTPPTAYLLSIHATL